MDFFKQAAKILGKQAEQQNDDDVHRMALRAGKQRLPDDPDEQAYAEDQGEHAEIAQTALQSGDFKRAIYHLGQALASDPIREEWLALLDQWIAAVGPRALDLVPLTDEQYFATLQTSQMLMRLGNRPDHHMEVIPAVGQNYHARVAVRAYVMVAQGKTKEAVTLLLQLLQVKPEIPYVLWFPRWQDQPGFADALPPEKVAAAAVPFMNRYPGKYVFSERGRAEIRAYLPLLRRTYLALADNRTNEHFLPTAFVYASALRKIGAFEEAAHIARALPATSHMALVTLAIAEETLGNLDASIAAYQQALKFQPNDVAVCNDLGTLFLNQGKLAEAMTCYEESARLEPGDPYHLAIASIAYLQCLQALPSEEALARLQSLAPRQATARRLLYFLQAPALSKLLFPGEALINLMRTLKAKSAAGELTLKAGATLDINVSSLESPSALLAAGRMLEARGMALNLTVAEVRSPDPRQPLRPVEYQLWRYEGITPIPTVPTPDPGVAEKIAALAQTPYALDRWHAPARALGERLGLGALRDLLAVMVHPPTTPTGWEDWDWIIAIQFASALTLAFLDAGWESSQRKAALISLIYGPLDWSGAAALIALALLARQETRIAIEFDQICCDLWHFGPGSPEWPLERAMVAGLNFVNNYSEEAKAHIDDYYTRLRTEREQKEQAQ